jgi:transcription antitermination factor NusA-like protein
MSIRIHELAKQVDIDSKELLSLLKERKYVSQDTKSTSSTLANLYADLIKEEFAGRIKAAAEKTASEKAAAEKAATEKITAPPAPPPAPHIPAVKTAADIAREPGYRAKISVSSTDPKVDPVGACVGARGGRVKTIVRELNGEKIDIIPYNADIKQFIIEALKPAVPRDMVFDKKNTRVSLMVDAENLAIAIGRRGQNARLTSRLVGWKLDIDEYAPTAADPREAAIQTLNKTLSLSKVIAERLVNIGMNSAAVLADVESADLIGAGFTEEETAAILAKVKK